MRSSVAFKPKRSMGYVYLSSIDESGVEETARNLEYSGFHVEQTHINPTVTELKEDLTHRLQHVERDQYSCAIFILYCRFIEIRDEQNSQTQYHIIDEHNVRWDSNDVVTNIVEAAGLVGTVKYVVFIGKRHQGNIGMDGPDNRRRQKEQQFAPHQTLDLYTVFDYQNERSETYFTRLAVHLEKAREQGDLGQYEIATFLQMPLSNPTTNNVGHLAMKLTFTQLDAWIRIMIIVDLGTANLVVKYFGEEMKRRAPQDILTEPTSVFIERLDGGGYEYDDEKEPSLITFNGQRYRVVVGSGAYAEYEGKLSDYLESPVGDYEPTFNDWSRVHEDCVEKYNLPPPNFFLFENFKQALNREEIRNRRRRRYEEIDEEVERGACTFPDSFSDEAGQTVKNVIYLKDSLRGKHERAEYLKRIVRDPNIAPHQKRESLKRLKREREANYMPASTVLALVFLWIHGELRVTTKIPAEIGMAHDEAPESPYYWVVTCPAYWGLGPKALLRNALRDSGLISQRGLHYSFSIVHEPEAAWVLCVQKDQRRTIRNKDVIITIDIGSGTIDTFVGIAKVCHDDSEEQYGPRMQAKPLLPASGTAWGAKSIVDRAMKTFEELFRDEDDSKENPYLQFRTKCSPRVRRIRRAFEDLHTSGELKDRYDRPATVQLAADDFKHLMKCCGVETNPETRRFRDELNARSERRGLGITIRGLRVKFNADVVRSWYEPVTAHCVDFVRYAIDEIQDHLEPSATIRVYCVGGFARQTALCHRIEELEDSCPIVCVVPENPKDAVASGAGYYGLQDWRKILSRKSLYSYGVKVVEENTQKYRDHELYREHIRVQNGKECIINVFKPIVRRDEEVFNETQDRWETRQMNENYLQTRFMEGSQLFPPHYSADSDEEEKLSDVPDRVTTLRFRPLARQQSQVRFELYASERRDVTFTDEEDCVKIGHVTLENDGAIVDCGFRQYDLEFRFDTEMHVFCFKYITSATIRKDLTYKHLRPRIAECEANEIHKLPFIHTTVEFFESPITIDTLEFERGVAPADY